MIHLYIKTHNITGLKYFGKTTKDPLIYKGSGLYWKRHLAIHGNDVCTEIYGSYVDTDICSQDAIKFSIINNIVESNDWANLRQENGKDGAPIGNSILYETRKKISNSLTGKPSPKSKYVIIEPHETRSKRFSSIASNTMLITNGNTNRRIKNYESIPVGWWRGCVDGTHTGDKNIGIRNKSGDNTRGKKIYNDGFKHYYFVPGTEPSGFISGKMLGYQGGDGSMKGKK